jgi:hypothetical protein
MKKISFLNVLGNALSGELPAAYSQLQSLKVFLCQSNKLTGTLPATWGALKDLQVLGAFANILTGE